MKESATGSAESAVGNGATESLGGIGSTRSHGISSEVSALFAVASSLLGDDEVDPSNGAGVGGAGE